MNLSELFIKRPIMTTLLMVAILFAGILAYFRLPISNLPNVTYPTITVSVSYPGMTPDVMAHAIALPLEKQLMAIPGAALVSSNNTLGSSSIVVQFNIDKNMTEARKPLGPVIIGGLCISQLITLFITPILYLGPERLSEKFAARG